MVVRASPPPALVSSGQDAVLHGQNAATTIFGEVQRVAQPQSPGAGTDAAAGSLAAAAAAVNVSEEVKRITPKELEEIRTLLHPPDIVRRTLEATCLILGAGKWKAQPTGRPQAPPWSAVQQRMNNSQFLPQVLCYDVTALRERPALLTHLLDEYFGGSVAAAMASIDGTPVPTPTSASGGRPSTPSYASSQPRRLGRVGSIILANSKGPEPLSYSRVQQASVAAAGLFRWCAAMVTVASAAEEGEPSEVLHLGDAMATNRSLSSSSSKTEGEVVGEGGLRLRRAKSAIFADRRAADLEHSRKKFKDLKDLKAGKERGDYSVAFMSSVSGQPSVHRSSSDAKDAIAVAFPSLQRNSKDRMSSMLTAVSVSKKADLGINAGANHDRDRRRLQLAADVGCQTSQNKVLQMVTTAALPEREKVQGSQRTEAEGLADNLQRMASGEDAEKDQERLPPMPRSPVQQQKSNEQPPWEDAAEAEARLQEEKRKAAIAEEASALAKAGGYFEALLTFGEAYGEEACNVSDESANAAVLQLVATALEKRPALTLAVIGFGEGTDKDLQLADARLINVKYRLQALGVKRPIPTRIVDSSFPRPRWMLREKNPRWVLCRLDMGNDQELRDQFRGKALTASEKVREVALWLKRKLTTTLHG
eukprot:TRINITY_DN49181_c0_g1_i1.p1 TRINITY_DN49181_c0_g1~~TRINITY_DN49181_c0_g1_i1.p1  ORF type:complete len:649 (+),score=179.82 TRINITY_DN49181_c0_g1_i1:84-2030(+)